jgi:membrane-bound serine protease (ClpP class)
MESAWIIITALTVTALGLIAVDFYLPGFVLGSIAVVLMLVGVVIGYNAYGTSVAAALVLVDTVLGLSAVYVALKYVPRTAAGRKMILVHEQKGMRAGSQPMEELVGRAGVAETVLRPAGVARLNGKRLDVVAESGMIERGSAITVIAVEGTRIVVRKT